MFTQPLIADHTRETSSVPSLVADCTAPQWLAAYVRSRHEKSVAARLDDRGIERFLPLYETTHHWKNGYHKVRLPLFPGYIFVHLVPSVRREVLEIPGVSYIVSSRSVPAPLPGEDIERLRSAIKSGVVAQPYPYLKVGMRVEVKSGPLKGMTGILQRWHGFTRVVVSVDLIMQSIAIEVNASDVERVRWPEPRTA